MTKSCVIPRLNRIVAENSDKASRRNAVESLKRCSASNDRRREGLADGKRASFGVKWSLHSLRESETGLRENFPRIETVSSILEYFTLYPANHRLVTSIMKVGNYYFR